MTAIAVPVEALAEVAAKVGACLHPLLQRLTDTTTGQSRVVPIPCGRTLAAQCEPCAERARRLRMQQCREGWHLADDPLPPAEESDQGDTEDPDLPGDTDSARRVRSTRRRQDVPDLPRLPVAHRTLGASFTAADGRTWRPSTFLTVTLPSYGRVLADGTPADPRSYDYRRATLDAMHLPELWDRLVQNLRRAAGYKVQYFATVEPQRRLAPHIHAAIRGAIPRRLLRQVIAATYHQVWWPQLDEPVYAKSADYPVWVQAAGGYVDSATGAVLPTWADAMAALEHDDAEPAHVLRWGDQVDIQGLIGGPQADRRVGYLTKYLTKAINQTVADDGEHTPRQVAHAARLHEEARLLPCGPECANWLRYGTQPHDAVPGLVPGHCQGKPHRADRLGCGGRRVLVSRYWTGKTLTHHAADRLNAVRTVLTAAGVDIPDGCSATEVRGDGQPRWEWVPLRPDERTDYPAVLTESIRQRVAWREQYERAKHDHPPPSLAESAA